MLSYLSRTVCFLKLGDDQLCSSLMSAGADVTAVSEEGSTPLHYLALSQSDEAANIATKIIGTKNPNLDINAVEPWEGYSPLMT